MTDYEENHFTDPKIPLPPELNPAFVVTEKWAEANSYAISQWAAMRASGLPMRDSVELAFGWDWANYPGIDFEKRNRNGKYESHVDKLALAVECNPICRKRLNAEIDKPNYIEESWSKTRSVLALIDMLHSDKTTPETKIKVIASLNAVSQQTRLPTQVARQAVELLESLHPGLIIGDHENGNAPGRPETPRARSRWKPSK